MSCIFEELRYSLQSVKLERDICVNLSSSAVTDLVKRTPETTPPSERLDMEADCERVLRKGIPSTFEATLVIETPEEDRVIGNAREGV
eukprot:scaffold152133_cov32-Tisochrysis_lutea.AAC.3